MQNPQMNGSQPAPMANEVFVLARSGIHFTAKSGRTKAEGSGQLFLSTLRMVFVAEGSSGTSFDMPLATLYSESFNQPIFGANNLTGKSPPLDLPEGSDHYKWCISFRNGGVGTFLPFFFRLLQEMRSRMQQAAQPQANATVQAEPIPEAIAQGLVQAAFVDPSDPTKFYISMPSQGKAS
jgi:hypothetical protein